MLALARERRARGRRRTLRGQCLCQEPKLSELEAVRIIQVLVAEAVAKSLMVSDGGGRELITLEDLLHRPEWHRRAACRGSGLSSYFPILRPVRDAGQGRL